MKNMPKVFLLASAISGLDIQAIFASEVGSEITLTDNERERERNSRAISTSGF